MREEEGVETMEMEEAMAVVTLMAGGNLDIEMAVGVGFQVEVVMGIRGVIIWVVAA